MILRLAALLLACVLGLGGDAGAQETPPGARQTLPQAVELPVRVRVALRVLNVLDIKEVAGQGRLQVELTQRWHDPRLAFDAIARGLGREDRVGEEADEHLKTIWTPGLSLDNQIGDKESRTVALSVYAHGDVVLIERFESDFRFRMNMDAFPFDQQNLTLSLSLPRYAQQEAVLLTTEADRQFSGIDNAPSVVDWRPLGLRFAHELAMGWNARSYSRLNVTVTMAREAQRYVLRVFVPIIAVLAVSLFVLWSPGLKEQDKGGLIFSSLLALAAISFTFESSFPGSISLNTPIAEMISLGYLYLVAVLMFEIILSVAVANPRGRWNGEAAALRLHLRWALPAIMLIVCLGAALRALPG
ncbi:neurotransmitter-gated ion-channel ligand-binding protein [Bosea sp. (in: a-proteobacteria)]|uniref:neurotransmitter-gated ion-channel ligand-binding protein n=1 Tax=Bosea sp. (in: a-proteobacteria) TaxID=1871050 RepID=UPI00273448E5|nr:neurotransmitter-gated ion-channel ligand-binding protein [Bosea sp. (in: a-proteobacteria)]MDP3406938.1 neurotransmitter-gated ion-channel ligand-binding protein [Bosea sp. (in: a-proteobacteria)]